MEANLPEDEEARLAALDSYRVLDTLPEQTYNDLTRLASSLCGTPMALITFIDQERQWFKAKVGVDGDETPRSEAFCAHTILQPQEMLIVPDARQDPRFADNPSVQGESHVLFYAGVPLVTSDGYALGTICVIDHTPRQLTAQQKDGMQALARQVMVHLELRRSQVQREQAEKAKHFLASVVESSDDSIITLDFDKVITSWNGAAERLYGYSALEAVGQNLTMLTLPGDLEEMLGNIDRLKHSETVEIFDTVRVHKEGYEMNLEVVMSPVKDAAGQVIGISTIARDITQRKQDEESLRLSGVRYRSLFESNPQPMWVYERATFGFLAVNDAAVNHYGYSWDEFLGMTLKDIRPPEEIPSFLAFVSAPTAPDGKRGIFRHRKKDGTVIEVEITTHDLSFEARPARLGLANDVTARRAAEKQISFQAHLLNEVGQAVIATDREGTVVYWNRYAETLYGWPAQDATGKKINTLTVPEMALGQAEEIMAQLHRGEPWSGEFIVQRRDGTRFPAAVTNTPIYNEDGALSGFIGISKDITALKQVELALRESEQRFQFMVATSGDALYQLRYDSLIYDYLSPAITTLTGFSPQEINAIGFRTLIEKVEGAVSYTEFPDQATRKQVRERGEYSADYLVRTKSGELKWLGDHSFPWRDDKGEVIGSVGSLSDITERKRAEAELKSREIQLADAQQIAHLGSWEVDFVTGARTWSDELYRIFGAQPQEFEITPEAFLQRVHPDDREFVRRTLAQHLQAHETIEYHHRIVRPDGTERILHERGVVVMDADGQLVRRFGTAQDVTELQQTQQALQQLNDELEERVSRRTAELVRAKDEADEANAAKSELLSRMSHELRTPLNAILGFGQILERQNLTPLQHESIGHILKGGHHLLGLVNEILDISRVEAGQSELVIEPVALVALVAECCSLMQPLAQEQDIRIARNWEETVRHHGMADRQRLKQVLLNLLSNAIKYNRPGGEVVVSAHETESGRIQLRVQDTGTGLTPQNIQKLFTPFERLHATDSTIEGTGLGLVISQRLIKAMNGTLGVESTAGKGSTFWIELPAADSWAQAPSHASEPPVDTLHAQAELTYTVLCIEDNPSNLRLIETIFEMRPQWTLLSAVQGGIGLDLARQQEPDLILLDLNLPDLHGTQVLARLQQSALTRDIPVIVVSADATPEQVKTLISAGAKAYLTKPLDLGQFLATLDEFLQS